MGKPTSTSLSSYHYHNHHNCSHNLNITLVTHAHFDQDNHTTITTTKETTSPAITLTTTITTITTSLTALTFAPGVEEHVDGLLVVIAEQGRLLLVLFLQHADLEFPLAHEAVRRREHSDVHRRPVLPSNLGPPLSFFIFVRQDELDTRAFGRLGIVPCTEGRRENLVRKLLCYALPRTKETECMCCCLAYGRTLERRSVS